MRFLLSLCLASLPCAFAAQVSRSLPRPPARMDPNTYFVDPVHGRDEGSGRSPDHPWRTLTHALPIAQGAPAQIMLAPGEYSEKSGERFPLRPIFDTQLIGQLPRGARILGPADEKLPVFEVAGLGAFYQLEVETPGVAFDVTFASGGVQRGYLSVDVAGVDVKAEGAFDVHLRPGQVPAFLVFVGSMHTEGSAIRIDGTMTPSQPLQLVLSDAVLRAGPNSAAVDLRAGGRGRVVLGCENSAFHASGAGLRLRPLDPLDVSVVVDSCVFHALGLGDPSGGPIVTEGTGALDVVVRRSIFSGNAGDVDLPGYDPLTYSLSENLVQESALLGVGGDIGGDPRFVDAASGDFHIRPDSAARGAASTRTTVNDAEGDPRGSSPDDGAFDIGLDEFYPRYHWFHPTPRLGRGTTLRIVGQPGDLAMAFASALEPSPYGGPTARPVGVGWQLGALISPRPLAIALIGPEGVAEVPVLLPRDLADGRLPTSEILTQIRYLTASGGTAFSANALVVSLR